jgi:tyrosyl-DNA phosphodiesterase 2
VRFRGRKPHRVPVEKFDVTTSQWVDVDTAATHDRDELTLATFNVWYDGFHAEQRYLAIAELLSRRAPDIMVFQEVTAPALDVLLTQPWIRGHYFQAGAVGEGVGNYGMLILSRFPIAGATYTSLPTHQYRGFLQADVMVDGVHEVVCCIHLDSGKSSARMRARQLRTIFRALESTENAVLLGDFNMRDDENPRIVAPYCDIWPTLRPDDGFTEDTSINLMLLDKTGKTRQVRFDRILVKGHAWSAAQVELIGTEPVAPTDLRVFPSDHFGVACRLVRNRSISNRRIPGLDADADDSEAGVAIEAADERSGSRRAYSWRFGSRLR